jgi:hypothetical protein
MLKKIAAAATVSAMLMATGAQAASFSAGSSADVARVLQADGITARTDVEGSKPYVAATLKDGTKFVVEYYHCDSNRLNCDIAIWTANWTETVSSDQLNRWNRWTFVCPIYGAADGKSTSVWMGVTVAPSDNAQTIELQAKVFTKCLDQFQEFLRDPEGFLKNNE